MYNIKSPEKRSKLKIPQKLLVNTRISGSYHDEKKCYFRVRLLPNQKFQKLVRLPELSKVASIGVFKTQSNIYNGAFLRKWLTASPS